MTITATATATDQRDIPTQRDKKSERQREQKKRHDTTHTYGHTQPVDDKNRQDTQDTPSGVDWASRKVFAHAAIQANT